jgi:hypothetical protein
MQAFVTSGLGVFLDDRSSNNTNWSYTTEIHRLSFSRDNTTKGSEDEVQNTLGNRIKFPQSVPNPNPPNMTQDMRLKRKLKLPDKGRIY